MRILFTGGFGKAGKHVITHLVQQQHGVLNLDLTAANIPGAYDMTADLTDLGQVISPMSRIVWL